MRFVTGYFLAQRTLQDRRDPRGSTPVRRRREVRLPVTRWLAGLRSAQVRRLPTDR
jgi:hypothetical protein